MTAEQLRSERLAQDAQHMTMEEIDAMVTNKEITKDTAHAMRLQLKARETRARFAAAAEKSNHA